MNTKLREEILNNLSVCVKSQKATDVILTGDLNESVCAKAVERFHVENRLFDTHTYINEINDHKRDSTYEFGTKQINSVAI